jgi:hypothetical protein
MIKKKNSSDERHRDVITPSLLIMPIATNQSLSVLISTPVATNQKFRTH